MSLSWRKRREVRLSPDWWEAFEHEKWTGDVTVVLSDHFARYTIVTSPVHCSRSKASSPSGESRTSRRLRHESDTVDLL